MKYLIEIEVADKKEPPENAQDIDLFPFLVEHLYDLTKNHDATKFVVIANQMWPIRDKLDEAYIKAILEY